MLERHISVLVIYILILPHICPINNGFDAECQTLLYSHLQVKLEEYIIQIDCYSDKTIDSYVPPALFKCMSLASCDTISLSIKNTDYRKLYIGIAAMSIPTEDDNIVYCALDTSDSTQVVTFTPHPSAWHYIEIGVFEGNISRISDCKSYYARSRLDEFVNYTIVDLMRVDKGRFFSFDYMLPSNDPHNDISLINITSSEIKSLRFKINQFVDIGGNLLISASFLINLRYFVGYGTEPEKQPLVSFTHDNQFLKAVICMDIGHPSTPLHSGHCKYNDKVTPALFVLYSVDSDSFYDKKYIPFPESGTWYLTLRIFCDAAAGPCKTVENGSIHYVDTSLDKEDDSIFISSEGNRTSCESTSECSTNIALVISSMPCVHRRCNNHGDCRLRAFGGLVMSFCSCFDGYGSWDCSDPRRMDSRTSILTAVLLLTLSNLLFILSIYVAIIRLYYTEAMVYTFTMFFSTFYHACDAPKQVALCICQHRILQFGDFYCAILSFWVTLLAVSIISDKFRSLLHLIGAVFAPILLAWNMFSFVPFTLLATTGLVILLISWYLDYRTNRIMKYAKSYYVVYIPMGLILVSIGFICFAFLQTERNYHIVHSVWHLIVASSVVLLLPDVRRGPNENAFLPSQIGKYLHKARSSPPSS